MSIFSGLKHITKGYLGKKKLLYVYRNASLVFEFTFKWSASLQHGKINGVSSTASGTVTYGNTLTLILSANTDYILPQQSEISVTNATIRSYDRATGTLVIEAITDDFTISASCPYNGYSWYSQGGSSITFSPSSSYVANHGTITTTLTPADGYSLPLSFDNSWITGTHGDVEYNPTTGILMIHDVTSDIVIRAYANVSVEWNYINKKTEAIIQPADTKLCSTYYTYQAYAPDLSDSNYTFDGVYDETGSTLISSYNISNAYTNVKAYYYPAIEWHTVTFAGSGAAGNWRIWTGTTYGDVVTSTQVHHDTSITNNNSIIHFNSTDTNYIFAHSNHWDGADYIYNTPILENETITAIPYRWCTVNFYDFYGDSALNSSIIKAGNNAYYQGTTPSLPSTDMYYYVWTGWSDTKETISTTPDYPMPPGLVSTTLGDTNKNVYAAFQNYIRNYPVNLFYIYPGNHAYVKNAALEAVIASSTYSSIANDALPSGYIYSDMYRNYDEVNYAFSNWISPSTTANYNYGNIYIPVGIPAYGYNLNFVASNGNWSPTTPRNLNSIVSIEVNKPSIIATYYNGTNITKTFNPATGYEFADLTKDGYSLANGTYTLIEDTEIRGYATKPKLATPVARIIRAVVSWNAITNATHYVLYVSKDGEEVTRISAIGGTSYDVSSIGGLEPSTTYDIQIQAVDQGGDYSPSDLSDAVQYTTPVGYGTVSFVSSPMNSSWDDSSSVAGVSMISWNDNSITLLTNDGNVYRTLNLDTGYKLDNFSLRYDSSGEEIALSAGSGSLGIDQNVTLSAVTSKIRYVLTASYICNGSTIQTSNTYNIYYGTSVNPVNYADQISGYEYSWNSWYDEVKTMTSDMQLTIYYVVAQPHKIIFSGSGGSWSNSTTINDAVRIEVNANVVYVYRQNADDPVTRTFNVYSGNTFNYFLFNGQLAYNQDVTEDITITTNVTEPPQYLITWNYKKVDGTAGTAYTYVLADEVPSAPSSIPSAYYVQEGYQKYKYELTGWSPTPSAGVGERWYTAQYGSPTACWGAISLDKSSDHGSWSGSSFPSSYIDLDKPYSLSSSGGIITLSYYGPDGIQYTGQSTFEPDTHYSITGFSTSINSDPALVITANISEDANVTITYNFIDEAIATVTAVSTYTQKVYLDEGRTYYYYFDSSRLSSRYSVVDGILYGNAQSGAIEPSFSNVITNTAISRTYRQVYIKVRENPPTLSLDTYKFAYTTDYQLVTQEHIGNVSYVIGDSYGDQSPGYWSTANGYPQGVSIGNSSPVALSTQVSQSDDGKTIYYMYYYNQ